MVLGILILGNTPNEFEIIGMIFGIIGIFTIVLQKKDANGDKIGKDWDELERVKGWDQKNANTSLSKMNMIYCMIGIFACAASVCLLAIFVPMIMNEYKD